MTADHPIRVVVADDHPVVRDGLRLTVEREAPDIDVTAEAGDGRSVLEFARTGCADVYILDITMPDLNGLETARRLLKMDAGVRVIILSLHATRAFVEEALQIGARGYLLKESATTDVIDAVRAVHAGDFFLSPGVSHFVVDGFLKKRRSSRRGERTPGLTSREREVLQLIAEGLASKEIAARLGLSVNTVRVHRTNLMAKLALHKETDLVRYAVKAGIAKL